MEQEAVPLNSPQELATKNNNIGAQKSLLTRILKWYYLIFSIPVFFFSKWMFNVGGGAEQVGYLSLLMGIYFVFTFITFHILDKYLMYIVSVFHFLMFIGAIFLGLQFRTASLDFPFGFVAYIIYIPFITFFLLPSGLVIFTIKKEINKFE